MLFFSWIFSLSLLTCWALVTLTNGKQFLRPKLMDEGRSSMVPFMGPITSTAGLFFIPLFLDPGQKFFIWLILNILDLASLPALFFTLFYQGLESIQKNKERKSVIVSLLMMAVVLLLIIAMLPLVFNN